MIFLNFTAYKNAQLGVLPLQTNELSLENCRCGQFDAIQSDVYEKSLCSKFASARGPKQKIISYTYFGSAENILKYHFENINYIVDRAKDVYSGWTVRLHLKKENLENPYIWSTLCHLQCKKNNIDICVLEDLDDKEFNDFSDIQVNGRFWRFLPLLDPLVDVFISRDIDAFLLDREVAAVEEWMSSPYSYHILRDHPLHCGTMLAGLWGVKTVNVRTSHYDQWVDFIYSQVDHEKHWDQTLLQQKIYKLARLDSMEHDSYCCKVMKGQHVRPFQVKRDQNGTWCGGGLNYLYQNKVILETPCPVKCRPKNHTDWVNC